MNLQNLIKEVSEDTEMTQQDVRKVLNSFFKVFENNLIRGLDIKIKDFASFKLVKQGERKLMNVHTREPLNLPVKYRVKTIWGKTIKERLSKKPIY